MKSKLILGVFQTKLVPMFDNEATAVKLLIFETVFLMGHVSTISSLYLVLNHNQNFTLN